MSPIYSYKCPKCETVTSDNRTIAERDVETYCENCQSLLQRILKFGSVAFRGSGFYSTDK
jgi:putative FmdB family regulatory protein